MQQLQTEVNKLKRDLADSEVLLRDSNKSLCVQQQEYSLITIQNTELQEHNKRLQTQCEDYQHIKDQLQHYKHDNYKLNKEVVSELNAVMLC